MQSNLDIKTVEGFGEEWSRFDQTELDANELSEVFERYFSVFPWIDLSADAVGFDLGCGSGRWAKLVAAKVGKLHCIDASSEALAVAKRNLDDLRNVEFHHASVDAIPLAADSMDFGYSLGVLHHIPNTKNGIKACVDRLKPDAPFLVYLYYAFDNRPMWFRFFWKLSDVVRLAISSLPFSIKKIVTDLIALTVYFPLAKLSLILEKFGVGVDSVPLSTYRKHGFYTMRTDSLDRFGTRLEQRFTRPEIEKMMKDSGLERIKFSDDNPYWCAVGFKSRRT